MNTFSDRFEQDAWQNETIDLAIGANLEGNMSINGVALVVEDDTNSASAISKVVASLGYETIIV